MFRLSVILLSIFFLHSVVTVNVAYAATNKNGVAVIIGNKSYNDRVPEVAFAHRDAAAIKDYVVNVLGYDELNIIDLRDATKSQLESAFGNATSHKGQIWQYIDPNGKSDVTVFYSGHGVPGTDGRGYLLPSDANPDTAEINGYPIDQLYANLQKLKTRSITVMLDACFSGDSGGGMLIQSASPVFISTELPTASKGMTVLTAASGTQLASWDEENQHGLFTHHLLDALYGKADDNKDGKITAGEVKTYLDDTMTRVARRTYRRQQDANLAGDYGTVLSVAINGDFAKRSIVDERSGANSSVGESFRDCETCPEMVVLPSGRFQMGSYDGDDNEKPVHEVTIAEPFAVGKFEITRAEFREFVNATNYSMGDKCSIYTTKWEKRSGYNWLNPSFSQSDRDPVVCMNWSDAKAYVNWLGQKTGKDYRLLSEAEWEYAARADSLGKYSFGNDESQLCGYSNGAAGETNFDFKNGACTDGYRRTAPVGSFKPNAFGLYDMHGNVWEWLDDCWNDSYNNALGNSSVNTNGDCSLRVIRGGAWSSSSKNSRSVSRNAGKAGSWISYVGVRVARTLDTP